MRKVLVILLIVVTYMVGACSGSGPKELFETAQFEELQNNKAHALELYEEIVEKHPTSKFAPKAAERIAVLKQSK